MTVVNLTATAPDVERLVQAFRDKYHLGPRNVATENAQFWRGVQLDGAIVAVFGERWEGQSVEITDGYRDETPDGLIGYAKLAYGYLKLVNEGVIDKLVHSCLFENKDEWRAVINATGDPPYALVFVHTKKEQV